MPKRLTNEEFLARARTKHGDRYEYLDPYTSASTPIRVRCKKHNYIFTPTPINHIYEKASGCPICASERRNQKLRTPPTEIIKLAEEVHGVGRYDYSQVGDFANISEVVDIICHKIDADGNEHGKFPQTFRNHIYSHQGCPKCKAEARKRLVFGVGINDTTILAESGCYIKWFQMLHRCYGCNQSINNPSYIGCSVCKEWHYLSNFKRWFKDPANGYREGYHLDKDLLVKGNKVYSPDTCCFLPPELNIMFQDSSSYRGAYPIGVQKRTKWNRYVASIHKYGRPVHLGYFHTPEEAFNAYKEAKESYIREVAQEYYDRGEITKKVYDALMRYEVEITD